MNRQLNQMARGMAGRLAGPLALGILLFAAPAISQPSGPASVADLAENLSDAVVNISTSQKVAGSQAVPMPEVPEGSPFKDFFDDFFDRQRRGDRPRKVQSLGSGFIIDSSGLVVTNNHVIADADEIVVNLNDGSKLDAELVGRDSKTDLAVLRVKPAQPLKSVAFGDSDKLRVGDWVMAIGNPFGLGGSVTIGIVSARNRNINSGPYDNFIQTDAAINRGNSGGPLFDMNGNVVGINTAIYSTTGGSVGIGFAVPSNTASSVIDQLIKFGQTRRGWIGVRIQDVTDEIAESLGMDRARGALIAGANPDGPAAAAGIKAGDVIIGFAGKPVPAMRDLPRIVADTEPNEEVEVVILRDGQEQTLKITVGRLKEEEQAAATPDNSDEQPETPVPAKILGAELSTLSPELREQFKIAEKVEGVIVLSVDADSPLAEKGIAPGTIIVEVAQEEVRAPGDVSDRLAELKKQSRKSALLLLSDANGELRFVAVPVPD